MKEHFQQFNNYFDKILVLTLPRLTSRIEAIKEKFDGLNYEFFYGTDKLQNSLESFKNSGNYSTKAYSRFYKRPAEMSLGMLCCSLGHMDIYNYISENKFSKTMILEDDAFPVTEHLSNFNTIISDLPDDWELFYMGYEKNESLGKKEKLNRFFKSIFPHHTQLKLSGKIFKNFYAEPLTDNISKAGFHDCTHAYAVTLEGARKLKNFSQTISFHPDNLLAYMNCTGKIKGYISRNKLFNQLSAFTNEIDSLTAD